MHKIVPGYSPTQEARARVRSYGCHSAVAANPGALRHAGGGCAHSHRAVYAHSHTRVGFKDSGTCCATQALGLQFVTPCTEDVRV